ncbi:MAG: galactokinase, partial [Christensenellaceae bacterium]|nr:galactokinase [Christensenellaceae bacterium]
MQIAQLKEKFVEIFGEGEARVFIGPARVNLIGEHIDYNGGNVFPCAISLRSACVARKRDD